MSQKKPEAVPLSHTALMAQINKKFGPGTVITAADPSLVMERIPCDVLSIDYLMGGGFPRGRHVEIFGGYSVGKTYTTQRLIAAAQRRGHECAFVDVENTFDPQFAAHCGVDLNALAYHRQRSGNQVVDFMETLLRAGEFGVIVLDSIAALVPKAEIESDMEAGSYGTQQAKMMSAALRRLTAANHKTCLVYINQTREAIGTMFGKRTTTSGGKAMGFYASARLEMTRVESIKRPTTVIDPSTGKEKTSQTVVGHRVLVRMEKDKTGAKSTGSTTSFVFDYEKARIDPFEDLIYLGRMFGYVEQEGNKLAVIGFDWVTGKEKFKKYLAANKQARRELIKGIKETIYGP